MKFVCAGYPKTGSKSASAALRMLGYNVADYIETTEFLTEEWLQFIDGRETMKNVVAAYDRNNFDTNQDLPGNVFWEEMYDELGGKDKKIKVILTIRDGDEIWYNSWLNFFDRNFNRYGIRLGTWMAWFGAFGKEIKEMTRIGVACMRIMFAIDCKFEHGELYRRFVANKQIMKQRYRMHTEYVKSVVPKEDLLIWNVKQGWAPLCDFLGHKIPECPLPRENMKGELFEKYSQTDFIKNVIKTTTMNITIFIGLLILFFYLLLNQSSVNTLGQNIFNPLYTTLNDLFMTS